MAYADYAFYSEKYKGTTIPSGRFDYYEMQAETIIRELTIGKSDDYADATEVKMATCAAAEQLYGVLEPTGSEADSAKIASENVGEYSVTYRNVTAPDQIKEARKAAFMSAQPWLVQTGLLYRGI